MRCAVAIWIRVVVVVAVCAAPAAAGTIRPAAPIDHLARMMAELAPESAQSGATIKRLYQDHLDLLMLREYAELAGALDNGGLVPLPSDPLRFNIVPRLDGPHPIGEKDLKNQSSYIAARPATIGALLEIASRVKSGPIEVTSLVRHEEYQESLRSTNPNATTSVPMHTMGLAVDIALVNTPARTVDELRGVLQKMQDDGDILFIGERKQLVFHVVPHPSRLGYFNDVYLKAVGTRSTGRFAQVVASMPGRRAKPAAAIQPKVTTEVVAMLLATGPAVTLTADGPPAVVKRPLQQASVGGPLMAATAWRHVSARLLILLTALSVASWWMFGRRVRDLRV